MDQKIREKIEKFEGLDICEHNKQRMYCPKCIWDVPAIFRKKHERFIKSQLALDKLS